MSSEYVTASSAKATEQVDDEYAPEEMMLEGLEHLDCEPEFWKQTRDLYYSVISALVKLGVDILPIVQEYSRVSTTTEISTSAPVAEAKELTWVKHRMDSQGVYSTILARVCLTGLFSHPIYGGLLFKAFIAALKRYSSSELEGHLRTMVPPEPVFDLKMPSPSAEPEPTGRELKSDEVFPTLFLLVFGLQAYKICRIILGLYLYKGPGVWIDESQPKRLLSRFMHQFRLAFLKSFLGCEDSLKLPDKDPAGNDAKDAVRCVFILLNETLLLNDREVISIPGAIVARQTCVVNVMKFLATFNRQQLESLFENPEMLERGPSVDDLARLAKMFEGAKKMSEHEKKLTRSYS